MTNANPQTRIGDLIKNQPEAMRYFESVGIDYCCGGHRPLGEACAAVGLDCDSVLKTLGSLPKPAEGSPSPADWEKATLTDLIAHIVPTHHDFLRTELPRLDKLVTKVLEVHGERHPEMERIYDLFQALTADLMPHLMKEEQILYPFIRSMESGQQGGACFGTVQSPIRVMEMEHEAVGAILAELRKLTNSYTAPADGCATFQALYQGLAGLEADIHLHIYLENQILHPRAIAMESGLLA